MSLHDQYIKNKKKYEERTGKSYEPKTLHEKYLENVEKLSNNNPRAIANYANNVDYINDFRQRLSSAYEEYQKTFGNQQYNTQDTFNNFLKKYQNQFSDDSYLKYTRALRELQQAGAISNSDHTDLLKSTPYMPNINNSVKNMADYMSRFRGEDDNKRIEEINEELKRYYNISRVSKNYLSNEEIEYYQGLEKELSDLKNKPIYEKTGKYALQYSGINDKDLNNRLTQIRDSYKTATDENRQAIQDEYNWLMNNAQGKTGETVRKAWHEDTQARIDDINKELQRFYSTQNKALLTKEEIQHFKDLERERDSLTVAVNNYKRGNTYVVNDEGQQQRAFLYGQDKYNVNREDPLFDTYAKRRTFDTSIVDEQEIKNHLNPENWHTEFDGKTYDQYGNEVTEAYINEWRSKTNAQDKLGVYLASSDEDKTQALSDNTTAYNRILNEGRSKFWHYLKDDEIDMYYYLLNKNGQQAALEFLDDMETELSRRDTEMMTEELREPASVADLERLEELNEKIKALKEKGDNSYAAKQELKALMQEKNQIKGKNFLAQAWDNVESVAGNIYGGILGTVDDMVHRLRGEDINPYSIWHRASNYSQAVRATTAEDFDKLWTDKQGNPIKILGIGLSDAYQSVMSLADMYAGNVLMGGGYGVSMGASAMESTARDLFEQGASGQDIFWGSLLAGVAEGLFEEYSLEKFLSIKDTRTRREWLMNILKQSFTEGSEEFFTEIANNVTDMFVRGTQSNAMQRYYEYRTQGDSEGTATWKALRDIGIDSWKAFVGGAISGGLGGMGRSGSQYMQYKDQMNRRATNAINQGNVQGIYDTAQGKNIDYSLAEQAYNRYVEEQSNKNENKAVKETANVLKQIDETRRNEQISDITTSLIEKGVSERQAKKMAPVISDVLERGYVTEEDDKVFRNNRDIALQVAQEARNGFAANRNFEYEARLEGDKETAEYIKNERIAAAAPKLSFDGTVDGQSSSFTYDHIDGDSLYVKTADGQVVNADDVQTTNRNAIQVMQDSVLFGDDGARAYLNGYEGGSASEYRQTFTNIYNQAKAGANVETLVSEMVAQGVSEKVARLAAYEGQNAYEAIQSNDVEQIRRYIDRTEAKKIQENVNQAAKGQETEIERENRAALKGVKEDLKKAFTSKRVEIRDADIGNLSQEDQGQLAAVTMMLTALGRKVVIMSNTDSLGNTTLMSGMNGGFDRNSNTYYINTSVMEHAYLNIGLHETVHDISKNQPKIFKQIREILEKYCNEYKPEALLDQGAEYDKARNTYSDVTSESELTEIAMEEWVANTVTGIIADPDTFTQFADKFMTESERKTFVSLLDRLLEALKEAFDKIKNVLGWSQIQTVQDDLNLLQQLRDLLFEGYQGIRNDFDIEHQTEETRETLKNLSDLGIEIDDSGAAHFNYSVRTWGHSEAELQKMADALVEAGFDEEDSKRWVADIDSVYSYVMENEKALSYENDERYSWLKKNSDYSQGSIDFNNNCPKRVEFTTLFDRLLKEFPNSVLTDQDFETIRGILKKNNIVVTCGICFVEDRRQALGTVAQTFIDQLKDGTLAPMFKSELKGDTYIPTQYDLITYGGFYDLWKNHEGVYKAFRRYNNHRGMASIRLVEGIGEYKNQIQKWSWRTINSKNNKGGLRIWSTSDADPRTMLDVMQIVNDAAAKGLQIQGYTKKPWFAKLVKDTGIRLLRSHIPAGIGYKTVNGEEVLTVDDVEGINTKDRYYEDVTDNPYIGNNIIGINDHQIRLAMLDPRFDQIIPFHSNQKQSVLDKKGIGHYHNYKLEQTEKEGYYSEGKGKVGKQINIYTDVIKEFEKRGKPIKNKWDFVNAYLQVCKEKDICPVFCRFLNKDENGDYTYTEGFHKFLVDYKMFDKDGNYIPQVAVTPKFDAAFATEVLRDYVRFDEAINRKSNPVASEKAYGEIKAALKDKLMFSVNTEAMDQQYMAAVNAKDMVTAQRMVDEAAERAGYIPSNMFHGSMNATFHVFDKSKANTEDNSGAGFYFTTNREDAEQNYADVEGADNFFKTSALADKILQDGEWNGIKVEDYDHAKQLAKDLLNKEPGTYEVYLKYDNPYYRDYRNSTDILAKIMDDFDESLVNRDDYDTDEDYEEGLMYARDEHIGEAVDRAVYRAYSDIEDQYEVIDGPFAQDVVSAIMEEIYNDDSLTWNDIKKAIEGLNTELTVTRADSIDTEFASAEFTRAIIENFGYDAIYDKEVSTKFNQLNSNGREADHIIVFHPNQIKLSDPVTYDDQGNVIPLSKRFNENNNDIRFSANTDSEGNELSPEQQEYFADSKVRDKDGRLLLVYHGSPNANITVFDRSLAGRHTEAYHDKMIWFTDNEQFADTFAHEFEDLGYTSFRVGLGKKGKVYPGYLNMKKPFDLRNPTEEMMEYLIKNRVEMWGADREYAVKDINSLLYEYGNHQMLKLYIKSMDDLRNMGYDGLIARLDTFIHNDDSLEYGIFESNQFKYADNKNPTENPDIRFSANTDTLGNELSEQQIEFFKNSQVRDEDGKLLVMYHGTRAGGFTIFDPRFSDDQTSLFFTSNRNVARTYTYEFGNVENWKEGDKGVTIYPVYLNLKNPLIIDTKGASWSAIQNGDTKKITAKRMMLGGFEFASEDAYNKFVELMHQSMEDEWYDSEEEFLSNPTASFESEYARYYRNNSVKISLKDFFDNSDKYGWYDLYSLQQNYDDNGPGLLEIQDYANGNYQIAVEQYKELFEEKIAEGDLDPDFYDTFFFNAMPLDNETYAQKDLHNTRWYAQKAKTEGYDGVLFENIYDSIWGREPSTVAIAFDSEQIKSIDNKNPTENPDIRYSTDSDNDPYAEIDKITERLGELNEMLSEWKVFGMSEEEKARLLPYYEERAELQKRYEQLVDSMPMPGKRTEQSENKIPESDLSSLNNSDENNVENLKKTIGDQYRLTVGKEMTMPAAEKIARDVTRRVSSKTDKAELAAQLKKLFDDAARQGKDLDTDAFMEQGAKIMRGVLEQSATFDSIRYKADEPIRKYLRETGIALNELQQDEAKYLFDSVANYRRALFGSVLIKNSGIPLDVAWQELNKMSSYLFPSDVNDGDMVSYLYDAAKALSKANYYVNEYGFDLDGAAAYEFAQVVADYTDNKRIKTFVQQLRTYGKRYLDNEMKEIRKTRREKMTIQSRLYEEQRKRNVSLKNEIANLNREMSGEAQNIERDITFLQSRLKYAEPGVDELSIREQIADLEQDKANIEARYREEIRNKTAQLQEGQEELEKIGKEYIKAGSTNTSLALDARKAAIGTKSAVKLRAQKEAQEIRTLQNNIRKKSSNLMSRLISGTDTKHVPENLREAVTGFLQAVDLGWNQGTLAAEKWLSDLNVLADKMAAANEVNGNFQVDSMIIDQLREMGARITERLSLAGKNLRTMSIAELNQLDDALSLVNAAIYNSDRLLADDRKQRASAVAERSITEMGKKKQRKHTNDLLGRVGNFFTLDQLDSFSYAERIGGPFKDVIFKNLRKAFDRKVQLVQQGIDAYHKAASVFGSTEKSILSKIRSMSGNNAQTKTFELESGKKLTLNTAQIMELYLLNERDQARIHLYNGGITVEEYKAKDGTVKKQEFIKVTEDDIDKIIGTLTKEQKKFANELQKYASSNMSEWGNDVSLTLWGVKKFTEQNYWPITVDDNTTDAVSQDKKNGNVGLYHLKNIGMSKAVNPKANNALVIGDVIDTFIRHVDEMTSYAAYTIPLDDAMKWYNYKNGNQTVQRSIESLMGKGGKAWFTDFIRALNSAQDMSGGMDFADTMIRNAKVAAIAANLRVVIQQPSAFARAIEAIDPKYLLNVSNLNVKQGAKEAQEHSSIARWKNWGFRDVNVGGDLRSLMVGDNAILEQVREKASILAGKADDATWGALWNACKAEIEDKRKDLEKGSEEYWQTISDRFAEVIDRTQVVDSPFHRSKAMRSKNALWKMYTSFMSEPTKTYNMFYRTISNAYQGNWSAETRKAVARATFAFAAATILNSVLAAIVDVGRDTDDEDWWEKYLENMGKNMLDGFNPLNLIPIGKDIVSIFDGYEASRMDLDAVSDLIKQLKRAGSTLSGEKDYNVLKIVYDSVMALSKITGIPAGNAWRGINSLLNLTGVDVSAFKGTWNNTNAKAVAEDMYSYFAKGDMAGFQRVFDKYVEDEVSMMVEEDTKTLEETGQHKYDSTESMQNKATKAVLNKLAQQLADNEEQIAEAYLAKTIGDGSEVARIRNEYIAKGIPEEVFDKAVNLYGSSMNVQPEGVNELNSKLYSYDDLYAAIESGDLEDIGYIYDEMKEDSQAVNPEKTIADNAVKKFKEQYFEYVASGQTTKANQLENTLEQAFGLTVDDLKDYQAGYLKYTFTQKVPEAENIELKAFPSFISKYNEFCKPANVPEKAYYNVYMFEKESHGEVDSKGKSIPYSKCVKVMAYIDSLNVTAAQKTALALCYYGKSTVDNYKLW